MENDDKPAVSPQESRSDAQDPKHFRRTNFELPKWLKKQGLDVGALAVALVAVFMSFQANDVARQAREQSARTYLEITPETIPTDAAPLNEVNSRFNSIVARPRYVLVYGNEQNAFVVIWLYVKNAGTNEAKDIELSVKLDFLPQSEQYAPILPIAQTFNLGDLAPGAARTQDILVQVSMNNSKMDAPGAAFQHLFEEDLIKARLIANGSYLSIDGKRIQSGRYIGTTSEGVSRIGLQSFKTGIIPPIKCASSSCRAK